MGGEGGASISVLRAVFAAVCGDLGGGDGQEVNEGKARAESMYIQREWLMGAAHCIRICAHSSLCIPP